MYFCWSASKILLLIQEHHLSVINIPSSWRWEINICLISQISSSNWILKHLFKHQSSSENTLITPTILVICLLYIMITYFLSLSFSFSYCLSLSSLMLASCFKFHINFLDTLIFTCFSSLFFLNKQVRIKPSWNKPAFISRSLCEIKLLHCEVF